MAGECVIIILTLAYFNFPANCKWDNFLVAVNIKKGDVLNLLFVLGVKMKELLSLKLHGYNF